MPRSNTPSPTPGHSNHLPTIHTFTLGPFATNCYVVETPGSEGVRRCFLVDASFEPDEMIDFVRDSGLQPEALILTHAHVDHMAGVDQFRQAFPGLPVYMHASETDWLTNPALNLSMLSGELITAAPLSPHRDKTIGQGDVLTLCGLDWTVLHIPGHSPGSIALYNAASAITLSGDALFAGSIGRTDFPGSSPRQLAASIREKLYTLPEATTVYPGHGPTTTIGREKRSNPFVRAE
jgi:glyoxylase-like metal-dependent hydrolase (beta-lactamase superfamily II)